METLAAGVWRSIQEYRPDAVLICHTGHNKTMPLWWPKALVRLAVLLARRRVGLVLTGDALSNAITAPLVRLAGVRRATLVMGLDLTYQSRIYRALVHGPLRNTPCVIAISEATAQVARDLGVDPDHVHVVRVGIAPPDTRSRAEAAEHLRHAVGLPASATVLVTLGRLVRRKGVRWFVENVLHQVEQSTHYVVAGIGPDEQVIRDAARVRGLSERVHILGGVDEDTRDMLLRGADLFVQPNIPVSGDMEGFGLVMIEAAMRGTPVVAADLEGIKDAVVDGRTGILLPPGDAKAWVARISTLLRAPQQLPALGETFRVCASELYNEARMGEQIDLIVGLRRR
jgi:glycosyltransferase involved in cell wall biosynthesis